MGYIRDSSDEMIVQQRSGAYWQIGIGLLALAVGAVLYMYDRPSTQVYFIADWLSQYRGNPLLFGMIGYHLPTFLHVFALCLITSAILGPGQRRTATACLFWLWVDSAFEFGQHPAIAKLLVPEIPDWFADVPVLENTASYFQQSRFDPLDLVSILMGAIVAYLLIGLVGNKHGKLVSQRM